MEKQMERKSEEYSGRVRIYVDDAYVNDIIFQSPPRCLDGRLRRWIIEVLSIIQNLTS
jgi:hypothetical protein